MHLLASSRAVRCGVEGPHVARRSSASWLSLVRCSWSRPAVTASAGVIASSLLLLRRITGPDTARNA